MSSINDKIRSILEVRLASISGVPEIAWENVEYSPTTGQSFLRPTFVPTLRRPAVRGINPSMRYQGIFTISCVVPEGNGPGAADALADLIIENFEATTDLTDGSRYVTIDYAERQQGNLQSPWYSVPVDIGWYCYA